MTMADLLSQNGVGFLPLKRGDVLTGEVIALQENEALVDLGTKAEGILPYDEVDAGNFLQLWQKITVSVLTPEDRRGQTLLSMKRAKITQAWSAIQNSLLNGEALTAEITGFNKGGITASISGVPCFLPFSQLIIPQDPNLSAPELQSKMDKMVGMETTVKVLEVDHTQNRVIVSERAAMTLERKRRTDEVARSLQLGQVVEVAVKEILPFGLLVSVSGIDALIPKDELSWAKDADLISYAAGQSLQAKVIELTPDSGARPKLSIKALTDDPWQKLLASYQSGAEISGKVAKITSFGVILGIDDGVEGLLPLSELPKEREISTGDILKLRIKALNDKQKSLELSLMDK